MVFKLLGLFIIMFVVCHLIYYFNRSELINHHKYSLVVDILASVGGIYIVFMGMLFYGSDPLHDFLLWVQIAVGLCLLNIHLARFIIRLLTEKAKL